MTFKYKWGSRAFSADPEAVAKEIGSIGKEVKPEQIVNYAEENEDSELHKCFTWDDTEAAKKYRIYEARQIICNLKITYVEPEKKDPITVRWSYRTGPDSGYKPTTVIMKNADDRAGMLLMAKKELLAFREKYKILSELQPIFDEINKIA